MPCMEGLMPQHKRPSHELIYETIASLNPTLALFVFKYVVECIFAKAMNKRRRTLFFSVNNLKKIDCWHNCRQNSMKWKSHRVRNKLHRLMFMPCFNPNHCRSPKFLVSNVVSYDVPVTLLAVWLVPHHVELGGAQGWDADVFGTSLRSLSVSYEL